MTTGTRETTCAGRLPARERMSLAMVPVIILALAGVVAASPQVFFVPGSTMLEPGETVELSFRVGACDDSISGYQLYLSFDPSVVELTQATEGSLYVESGETTWFISDEVEPGLWHFFDVVMGGGTYVLPPGELLHLKFTALDYGTTQAYIESILLADIRRENLPVGGYEHAWLYVVPQTGVEEGGGIATLGPAYPNPFSSVAAVPFFIPGDSAGAEVAIYDLRGRLVKRLRVPAGGREGQIAWDGTDADGTGVPASVYFLRLEGTAHTAECRLVRTK